MIKIIQKHILHILIRILEPKTNCDNMRLQGQARYEDYSFAMKKRQTATISNYS